MLLTRSIRVAIVALLLSAGLTVSGQSAQLPENPEMQQVRERFREVLHKAALRGEPASMRQILPFIPRTRGSLITPADEVGALVDVLTALEAAGHIVVHDLPARSGQFRNVRFENRQFHFTPKYFEYVEDQQRAGQRAYEEQQRTEHRQKQSESNRRWWSQVGQQLLVGIVAGLVVVACSSWIAGRTKNSRACVPNDTQPTQRAKLQRRRGNKRPREKT